MKTLAVLIAVVVVTPILPPIHRQAPHEARHFSLWDWWYGFDEL